MKNQKNGRQTKQIYMVSRKQNDQKCNRVIRCKI